MRDDDAPAAHSMDTQWFAVDAAGRVLLFDSDEPGAVVAAALVLSSPDDFFADGHLLLGAALGARWAAVSVRAAEARATEATASTSMASEEPSEQYVVIEGSDAALAAFSSALHGLAASAPARQRNAGPVAFEVCRAAAPVVVVLHASRELVAAAVAATAGAQLVGSSAAVNDLLRVVMPTGEADDDRAFGAVRFSSAAWEGEAAGDYRRSFVPAHPLHVDDLPAPVRERISAVRLPIDALATEHVQLADHFPRDAIVTWNEDEPLRVGEQRDSSWAGGGSTSTAAPGAARSRPQPLHPAFWLVATLVGAGAAALWWVMR